MLINLSCLKFHKTNSFSARTSNYLYRCPRLKLIIQLRKNWVGKAKNDLNNYLLFTNTTYKIIAVIS